MILLFMISYIIISGFESHPLRKQGTVSQGTVFHFIPVPCVRAERSETARRTKVSKPSHPLGKLDAMMEAPIEMIMVISYISEYKWKEAKHSYDSVV